MEKSETIPSSKDMVSRVLLFLFRPVGRKRLAATGRETR